MALGSRVGGQAQSKRQKKLSTALFKTLARYKQAEEFAHFGSKLSKEATIDLNIGKQIYQVLQQPPEELHNLVEQQLMLETVMLGGGEISIDIPTMKSAIREFAQNVKDDADYDRIEAELLSKYGKKPTVLKEKDGESTTVEEKKDA